MRSMTTHAKLSRRCHHRRDGFVGLVQALAPLGNLLVRYACMLLGFFEAQVLRPWPLPSSPAAIDASRAIPPRDKRLLLGQLASSARVINAACKRRVARTAKASADTGRDLRLIFLRR